ncbi:MAG: glucosamine-6-phosphate deaminase [Planctomycetes bacterium]|nr:glucosamine-6-phosphate deaminase [Planctomycetota bacterium]
MHMSSEKVPVRIYEDAEAASKVVAGEIARLVAEQSAAGRATVLGLATGHTPLGVYRELARRHREDGLDFSRVVTFNLDEYWPIEPSVRQSYHAWMHENLFRHVNVRPENIHLPSGTVAEDEIGAHCAAYEQAIRDAGGIDYQILGIGNTGHIGFNEPGATRHSRTRRVRLDRVTRKAAASDFFGEENVPEMALTMGVATIMEARQVRLLAFGEHKAPILKRAVEGEVTSAVAASYLHEHPDCVFHLDEAAAAHLTRLAAPWLMGPCEWDERLQRQAVVWLAGRVEKPILKLTDEDYNENGLGDLVRQRGGAYRINIAVFRHLMNTITGWPGGKDRRRRVLLFSPHPDDDVISMGGTLIRFVEQGHEVRVAHMVTGYLAVFDHNAARHADFVANFNHIFGLTPEQTAAIEAHIDQFLRHKQPGDLDTPEVRAVKTLVRRIEALDAARFCGLPEDCVHFLELPFYEAETIEGRTIGPEDVDRVRSLLESVKPDMIFAAGDLSDPHGTHRVCLQAVLAALEAYTRAGNAAPELWLYRGAWQEWPVHAIDMAVPLSPDELLRKRYAIFRHESQKDRAMFPGPSDTREFWQRAETRNMATAQLYDALGLPEYHGIEAFARWPLCRSAHAEAQLQRE